MTLEEAIKHAEEAAEEYQRVVDTGIVFDDVTIDMMYCDDTEVIEEHLANYQRRAEERRQLAEWLKDYKRLLEQQPCEDIKEIREVMSCDADAETKCKMISNILTAKPHYFKEQELCDAISRQAVLALATEECETAIIPYRRFVKDINALPPCQPQSKIGHWIEERNDYGEITHWHCSNCYDDSGFITTCKWDFCPNCGAKMVEPQESEEV